MPTSTYAQKLARRGRPVEHVVVVYPFTYVNPYTCLPPIGAEYVQAGAVAAGKRTRLLDMRFEKDARGALAQADVVVLYGFFEDCSLFGKWGIHVIDEVLAQVPPDVPVVAGGTGFGNVQETLTTRPRIDAVVVGMPNVPVRELLEAPGPEGIRNLSWRADDGSLQQNPRVTHRLSEDVWPRRELRDPRYRYHTLGVPIDLVRAAQGCNYHCRFCYQYGKDTDGNWLRWQSRSPESQLKELQQIAAPMVLWVDDDMTTDMEALDRLADLLIAAKVEKVMIGTGRIDHVIQSDVARLKKLERAGLLALTFGVESLSDETLRFYRKGQSVEMAEKAMAMMAQTNVLLVCNFLLGSPGESEEQMMENLWFGRRWNVDHIVTNRLRVQEGSELERLITDPVTKQPLPGMERIRGERLKRIKQAIKFGQLTPFHLASTVLKLYRHRGLPLDPLFLVSSALETAMTGTWLDRSGLARVLFWAPKRLGRWKPWRAFTRGVAYVLSPVAYALTKVFEGVDRRFLISTRALPSVARLFDRKVLEKQKLAAQLEGRSIDEVKPPPKAVARAPRQRPALARARPTAPQA